jgi:hypothetical protein
MFLLSIRNSRWLPMHDKVFMKDPTEKYFSSEITELFKSKLERNVLFVMKKYLIPNPIEYPAVVAILNLLPNQVF